jgi:hypothetical protein
MVDQGDIDEVNRLVLAVSRALGEARPPIVAGVITKVLAMAVVQYEERDWSPLLQDIVKGTRMQMREMLPHIRGLQRRRLH